MEDDEEEKIDDEEKKNEPWKWNDRRHHKDAQIDGGRTLYETPGTSLAKKDPTGVNTNLSAGNTKREI